MNNEVHSKWLRSTLHHKKNYNLNQEGTDTIHAAIPTNDHNYPSSKIIKHANVLVEVNKLPYVRLLAINPNGVQYYNPLTHNDHIGY